MADTTPNEIVFVCRECEQVITDTEEKVLDGVCYGCCEEISLGFEVAPVNCHECPTEKCNARNWKYQKQIKANP